MKIEVSATKRARAGNGCEPPPAPRRQGPGHPLRRQRAAAHDRARAQRALPAGCGSEAFHASILTLELDGQKQQVLLRAINMHPWKPQVQHVDFQRVHADQKIHMRVPLHFVQRRGLARGEGRGRGDQPRPERASTSPACPPICPEFIEVDLSKITVGHSIHVNELAAAEGRDAGPPPRREPGGRVRVAAEGGRRPRRRKPQPQPRPSRRRRCRRRSRCRRPRKRPPRQRARRARRARRPRSRPRRRRATRSKALARRRGAAVHHRRVSFYGHQTDRRARQSGAQARARPPQRRLLARRAARGARACGASARSRGTTP